MAHELNLDVHSLGLEYGLLERAQEDLCQVSVRLGQAFSAYARALQDRRRGEVRIALYGASKSGRAALGFLRACPGVTVVGFVDEYSISDDIAGLPCVSLARAQELYPVDAFVVAVAPRHLPGVIPGLAALGAGVEICSMYATARQTPPDLQEHEDAPQRFASHEYSSRLREFLRQERGTPRSKNERPGEYAFIFNWLARLYPDSILDVGAGSTSLPHLMHLCGFDVTAIDLDPLANRHYYLEQADIVTDDLGRKFQTITCVSTLEHIPLHDQAVANMHRHLLSGGVLLLTVPFHETQYVPNIHDHAGTSRPCSTGVTRVFSRREVDAWLAQCDWELVGEELYAHFSGPLFTLGEEFYPMRRVNRGEAKADLACLALRKR